LGVLFGLLSLVGIHDNHARWVKLFVYFAIVRVIARFFIFWADFAMLKTCENLGLTSVNGYYNPAMETVKLTHRCEWTTWTYTVISVFDIVISLYGIYNAWRWCSYTENTPMYHICLDDTKPLRIYTGYSTVGHPEKTPDMMPPKAAFDGYGPPAFDGYGPQYYGTTMGPPSMGPGAFGHPSMALSSRHMYPTGAIPQTLPPASMARIPQ
jgi:hypothetical protein